MLSFPRSFANISKGFTSYIQDNFDYIKSMFGSPNGFATLDSNGEVEQNSKTASVVATATNADKLNGFHASELPGAMVFEHTVSGGAVTIVDTGVVLGGIAHGGYDFEIEWVPVGSPGTGISIYAENDTTSANYYSQTLSQDNTSITGLRANSASMIYTDGSTRTHSRGKIMLASNGEFIVFVESIRGNAVSMISERTTVKKISTISNITQIKFSSSVGSNIGVGSRFRLWRRK